MSDLRVIGVDDNGIEVGSSIHVEVPDSLTSDQAVSYLAWRVAQALLNPYGDEWISGLRRPSKEAPDD